MRTRKPNPRESRGTPVAIVEGAISDRTWPVRAPSAKRHAPGDILAGKYQIIGLLGEGGMGTVWRAHSLLLDVDVAIKVLHREHEGTHIAERLLREARATASLGHSAIVRALDFGETDTGEPFLVMELLEGISLAVWLRKRGRMTAAQAVQMLLPVADGLAVAHAHGVVHRDIKPENIIAVPDGAGAYLPKIVDFGIAKLARRRGQVLTRQGMVLGSLQYMSPEQANGDLKIGEQTDVWSLCVVLYELITGQRPFEGSTIAAMSFALFANAPTPTTQLAAGDEELWAIIERGLQRSLTERWPDMRSLGQALASWAVARGITSDAAGTSITHHWLERTSGPQHATESDSGASAARTVTFSRTLRVPVDRPSARSDLPAAPVVNTSDSACISTDSPSRVTPPWGRMQALLVSAVLALVILPVAVVAGFYSQRGDGSASPGDHLARAAAPDPTTEALAIPATPSLAVPPDTPEVPSAVAAPIPATKAISSSKTRDPRAAPVARPKRSSTGMPLPAAPNF